MNLVSSPFSSSSASLHRVVGTDARSFSSEAVKKRRPSRLTSASQPGPANASDRCFSFSYISRLSLVKPTPTLTAALEGLS